MKLLKGVFIMMLMLSLCGFSYSTQKLKRKADDGDVASQYELAVLYYRGSKDVKPNKKLSMKYYKKAAAQGNLDAIFDLGKNAENNKEYETALNYYEQAANKNHAASQTNLGLMYQNAVGIPKDVQKAEYWYKKAYENGDILGQRNLAILYEQEKRYVESEEQFKALIFTETNRSNSTAFKRAVCLGMMKNNYANKQLDKAYLWGSVAIIAGIFDGRVNNAEQHLKMFEEISSNLSEEKKKALSKEVISYHYKAFQKYEYYLQKHPELQSSDGIINISGSPLMHMTGYLLAKNKENYARVNYFKNKEDDNSKINYAIGNLKIAASYIRLGSIIPNYLTAKTKISESKSVLDSFDWKNLNLLKKGINNKLKILGYIVQFMESRENLASSS